MHSAGPFGFRTLACQDLEKQIRIVVLFDLPVKFGTCARMVSSIPVDFSSGDHYAVLGVPRTANEVVCMCFSHEGLNKTAVDIGAFRLKRHLA